MSSAKAYNRVFRQGRSTERKKRVGLLFLFSKTFISRLNKHYFTKLLLRKKSFVSNLQKYKALADEVKFAGKWTLWKLMKRSYLRRGWDVSIIKNTSTPSPLIERALVGPDEILFETMDLTYILDNLYFTRWPPGINELGPIIGRRHCWHPTVIPTFL